MNGIRVNLQTGEITHLEPTQVWKTETRHCERCHHIFEVEKGSKRRFCSLVCGGEKGEVKEKPKQYDDIVPFMRIKDRVKKPHFVNNPHQWANAVYGKYKAINQIPRKDDDEYGLYKYGEWLFNNERF